MTAESVVCWQQQDGERQRGGEGARRAGRSSGRERWLASALAASLSRPLLALRCTCRRSCRALYMYVSCTRTPAAHLHSDDGPPLLVCQPCQARQQLGPPGIHSSKEAWVAAAHRRRSGSVARAQPGREAARLPLRTDVGTWPQQHHQARLMRERNKAHHVAVARPGQHTSWARSGRMEVPRHWWVVRMNRKGAAAAAAVHGVLS
jgi:hypothetical protein